MAQDFFIKIDYSVYTIDKTGNKLRLVGYYPCKCVAKDVVEYLRSEYRVKSEYFRKIKDR